MFRKQCVFTGFASCYLAILFLAGACSSFSPDILNHPTTKATLWVQHSAEYRALTISTYRAASSNLALAIEDSYWTASPAQKGQNYQSLPPAIILDVDETILDNSPFQARMIEQNSGFNPQEWEKWVLQANAEAVPGAVAFTKLADDKGVKIFYITNREASVEKATRKNLQSLGFPLSADDDVILSKNEHEDWTSSKVNRRAYVLKNYRVLMLFGDDLNDFLSAKNMSEEQRNELVAKNTAKWARSWYILPNPVYGSWEQALYNFDATLTDKEISIIKKSKLRTRKEE